MAAREARGAGVPDSRPGASLVGIARVRPREGRAAAVRSDGDAAHRGERGGVSQPGLATQIGAATSYEEGVVPALMREWAPRVVAAGGIRPGDRVLDVACGTGVLSRVVAEAVGRAGSVTGLDLDPGMLAIAARTAPRSAWLRGVAESLPFRDATFDAVVSQFGLMFFQDRSRALREMWRVLRPGGRMAGSAAADVLRSPFVLGNRAVLEQTFAAAEIPLSSLITQAAPLVETRRRGEHIAFPTVLRALTPGPRGEGS